MKFLILTTFGTLEVEAKDFDEATELAYQDQTGYENVLAIVRAE